MVSPRCTLSGDVFPAVAWYCRGIRREGIDVDELGIEA